MKIIQNKQTNKTKCTTLLTTQNRFVHTDSCPHMLEDTLCGKKEKEGIEQCNKN